MKTIKINYDNNNCEIEYSTNQEYALLRKLESESDDRVEQIKATGMQWLIDSALGKVRIVDIRTEYGVQAHAAMYNPETGLYDKQGEAVGDPFDRIVVTFAGKDGDTWYGFYNPETLGEHRAV